MMTKQIKFSEVLRQTFNFVADLSNSERYHSVVESVIYNGNARYGNLEIGIYGSIRDETVREFLNEVVF